MCQITERMLLLVQGEGNLTGESEGTWLQEALRSLGIIKLAALGGWSFFKL